MFLHKLTSKVIIVFKREPFDLDARIPLTYLVSIILGRIVMAVNGIFVFGCIRKRSYISHSTKIKCASKIKIGNNLSISRGCYIDALSIEGIRFGNNVSIGKYTCIECSGTLKDLGKGLIVGNNVGLGTHGFFGCAGGVSIGDNTIFGNYVSVHSENHNYKDRNTPIRLQGVNRKGIKIGRDCWIGAKVTILDGADIGDGCIVAAGAVVRGKIPSYSIIGGVPAKVIKER